MKTDIERYEIRIAGFGGQGVVTVGRILGTAFSVFAGINSVNTQSYGPESRGGACRSEVVISSNEINYPYVRNADVLVALSQVALDTYLSNLKKGGLLVVDADTVNPGKEAESVRLMPIPVAAIAHESGGVKYQNVVALGALQFLIDDLIKTSPVIRAIKTTVPHTSLEINLMAFEKGREFVRNYLDRDNE